MHTFMKKPLSRLRMRRLTAEDIGPSRSEILTVLTQAPDPFASLNYQIDIAACRQRAKEIGAAQGRRILLTPVLVKLIAHAVEENPRYNQIVLGGRLYQIEDIHIASLAYIPERDAVTNIVLKNPQRKALADIQQELLDAIAGAKTQFGLPPNPLVDAFTRLCCRYRLYRLVGQRLAFKTIYERDLLANIILSVHTYATPANFTMVKDIIAPLNLTPRIHASGPFKKPVVENGMLAGRDMLDLHVTTDHRIISGMDSYHFGMSLERIAAHPDRYFA